MIGSGDRRWDRHKSDSCQAMRCLLYDPAPRGLEGETPDLVEDRLTLAHFYPQRHVGAMAHHQVCACIDGRMGDLHLVIQDLMIQAPMMAGDDDVGLAPQ